MNVVSLFSPLLLDFFQHLGKESFKERVTSDDKIDQSVVTPIRLSIGVSKITSVCSLLLLRVPPD